jgi:hypothetical protein
VFYEFSRSVAREVADGYYGGDGYYASDSCFHTVRVLSDGAKVGIFAELRAMSRFFTIFV